MSKRATDAAIAEATDRAIEAAGGAAALSRATKYPLSTIYSWWDKGRIPTEQGQVLRVEAAVDCRVTRYQMRPDVYGQG